MVLATLAGASQADSKVRAPFLVVRPAPADACEAFAHARVAWRMAWRSLRRVAPRLDKAMPRVCRLTPHLRGRARSRRALSTRVGEGRLSLCELASRVCGGMPLLRAHMASSTRRRSVPSRTRATPRRKRGLPSRTRVTSAQSHASRSRTRATPGRRDRLPSGESRRVSAKACDPLAQSAHPSAMSRDRFAESRHVSVGPREPFARSRDVPTTTCAPDVDARGGTRGPPDPGAPASPALSAPRPCAKRPPRGGADGVLPPARRHHVLGRSGSR